MALTWHAVLHSRLRQWIAWGMGVSCCLVASRAFADSSEQGRTTTAGSSNFEVLSTSSSSWDGLSELARTLREHLGPDRVRVRATLDYEQLRPQDAVWILAPSRPLQVESLTRFLAAGGRVALADDYGASVPFLARFGIVRVPAPSLPALRVDGNPELAIATPVGRAVAGIDAGRHPMTAEVDLVVTNHPMAIEHPALTPLLEIESSRGPAATLAVSGVIAGKGRLVVVGDPSIFINLMLRYPGNRAFALGLADNLLAQGGPEPAPAGTATNGGAGRLWLLAGAFEQEGSFGTKSWLDGPKERLADLERAASRIEEEGLPPWAWWIFAFFLWFVVARSQLEGQLRLPRLRRPLYARPAPLAAQSGPQARAAVLAAPSTSPLVPLLELGTALEERLMGTGGSLPQSRAELESTLARCGIQGERRERAVHLVEALRRLRDGLSNGRPPRPSAREAKRIHRETMQLVGWLANERADGAVPDGAGADGAGTDGAGRDGALAGRELADDAERGSAKP
ncbi:MAG TPA: DUF4350 domain-containing protein [Polyangiaceae bacterium]|nr:DUF4350 domain-containing protein [Polyangiaceae bacterium]